jgi:DNA-binding response OmpR family regulator
MENTMVQSINDNHALSGVTVLLVEDDFFLAMAVEETLIGLGAVVVDVCHTLDEAMARADADDFAVAVLDFSLGPDSVTPLARRLARRNAPFTLHTECRAANQAW